MQTIFSSIAGLLSGALYVLFRTVLLLDRLIEIICHLSLWGHIHRTAQAVRRKRTACAFLAFVPIIALPCAFFLHSGTLVTVDGCPLGMVDKPETLRAAVANLESSAAAVAGRPYTLPLDIRLTQTAATAKHFLSRESLESALTALSDELSMVAVISIDGQKAAVCRSAEDAQWILERVKQQYSSTGDTDVRFLQTVHVENAIAETALATNADALYASLVPQLDVQTRRAVTYKEPILYKTVTRENDTLAMNRRSTVQSGQVGEAQVTAELEIVDGRERARTILERTVLRDATDEIIEVGTKDIRIGSGAFHAPLTSYTFTSGFKQRWGRLHGGVDLAVPEGTPVYAADNGKVIAAEEDSGYGWYLILDHGNGFKTLYAHNSTLLAAVGDVVEQGEKIALSGNTGNSTGPHLHFEIRVNDEQVDPQRYLTLT